MIKINLILSFLMFTILCSTSFSSSVASQTLLAQSSRSKQARRYKRNTARSQFSKALRLFRGRRYRLSAQLLYKLSNNSAYSSKKYEIRYLLGRALQKLGLLQSASFQFIGVAEHGSNKFVQKSLAQLSLVANELDDDTALDYAISKININKFPRSQRSMLYFRIGEAQLRNKNYTSAVKNFSKVSRKSIWYRKAQYLQGLGYSFLKKNRSAIRSFDRLINSNRDQSLINETRTVGLLGKARVFYQAQQWDKAIEYYKQIPRDSQTWRESLFESSWAMLRSGKFRSAISNFQTIHSPYYENFYQPESLVLRSIVYLYICQYEEMKKTLSLFNRVYSPVQKSVKNYLRRNKNPKTYFSEIYKFLKVYELKGDTASLRNGKLPFMVSQYIVSKADIKRSYRYITKINKERRKITALGTRWRRSALGRQLRSDLSRRIIRARRKTGKQIKLHLERLETELIGVFEQEGFARFEMLNGRRQELKKKVADRSDLDIYGELNRSRDFYIKNGYEYWPFQGEYWLDELGNYHYVGAKSCR